MRLSQPIGVQFTKEMEMARTKKKWVQFQGNSIVPAAVLGTDEDQKMIAGAPVNLPEGYADHVISLRIARECEAPKKLGAKTALSTLTDNGS